MNLVHAHELLEKIAFSESIQSLQYWKDLAKSTFGEDVQFENCGGMKFNVDSVFDFFVSKKKVSLDEQGMIHPFAENICSGPGHHH